MVILPYSRMTDVLTKEAFIALSREQFGKAIGEKVFQIYEKKRCTLSFDDELGHKVVMKLYEFWPIVDSKVDPEVYSVKVSVRVDGIHPMHYELHKKRGIQFGVSEAMYEPYSDVIDMLVKQFC